MRFTREINKRCTVEEREVGELKVACSDHMTPRTHGPLFFAVPLLRFLGIFGRTLRCSQYLNVVLLA